MRSTKVNYLNNKDLLADIAAWRESGKERMPEGLAKKILMICQRLAFHPRFNGYTHMWKEDFTGDAVEHCIRYAKNFDPNKSNNPFAYFTTIAWNAFFRRINIERKSLQVVQELIKNAGVVDEKLLGDCDIDDPTVQALLANAQITHQDYSKEYVVVKPKVPKKKKEKPQGPVLDAFVE